MTERTERAENGGLSTPPPGMMAAGQANGFVEHC
jgi:hypothetical protein